MIVSSNSLLDCIFQVNDHLRVNHYSKAYESVPCSTPSLHSQDGLSRNSLAADQPSASKLPTEHRHGIHPHQRARFPRQAAYSSTPEVGTEPATQSRSEQCTRLTSPVRQSWHAAHSPGPPCNLRRQEAIVGPLEALTRRQTENEVIQCIPTRQRRVDSTRQ